MGLGSGIRDPEKNLFRIPDSDASTKRPLPVLILPFKSSLNDFIPDNHEFKVKQPWFKLSLNLDSLKKIFHLCKTFLNKTVLNLRKCLGIKLGMIYPW